MQATVIKVEAHKLKDKWDGFNLTYKGDPYQGREKDEVTRFVFGNSDMGPVVKDLKAGMRVNLTFQKEGKHSNLVGVEVLQTRSNNSASTNVAGKGQSYDDTQKRISRSAAMKEATAIVLNGASAKTKKEDIVRDVISTTMDLERFLNFDEDILLKYFDMDDTSIDTTTTPDDDVNGDDIPF